MWNIRTYFLLRFTSSNRISEATIFTAAEGVLCAWIFCIFGLSIVTGVESAWRYGLAPFATLFVTAALIIRLQLRQSFCNPDWEDWKKVSVLFIAFIVASKLLWVLFFDSAQISDFGVYFRCGISQVKSLKLAVNECQSSFLEPNSTYWLRSFFYSFPIGSIFNENYAGFKLSNAFLHIITVGIWYFGVHRSYGPRVALASSALFVLYPEYWFTATLVSTDNAALLFIVLFILALPRIGQSGKIGVVTAVALGMVIFFAQQLRSIGLILLISTLAWILLNRSKCNIYKLFIVFASYYIFQNTFSLFFSAGLPDLFNPLKILSAIDFHSTQDFSVNYLWAEHYWPALPQEMLFDTAIHKTLVELSQFYEWPVYLLKKTSIIFSGTGYYGLSSFNYPSGNPDSSLVIAKSTIPFLSSAFPWLGVFSCLIIFSSLKTILFLPKSGPAFASIVLIGAFSLVVLGMGEAQARYSLLIAPALALLASLSFFPQDVRKSEDPTLKVSFVSFRFVYGVICIAATYLAVVVGAALLNSEGNISERATLATRDEGDVFGCNNKGIDLNANYKEIKVSFDKGADCAVFYIKVPEGKRNLSFFVSGSKFPYRFEDKPNSPFSYNISSGGAVVLNEPLGYHSVVWRQIPLQINSDKRVYFYGARSASDSKDYLLFSLLRAN